MASELSVSHIFVQMKVCSRKSAGHISLESLEWRRLGAGQEEELGTVGSGVIYWTMVTASWMDSAT